MTFQKGKSGNPGGGQGEKKNQQKRLIKDLMTPHGPKAVKVIVSQLDLPDPLDQRWAAEIVLNYAYGKPTQAVEVSGEDGGPLSIIVNLIKNK